MAGEAVARNGPFRVHGAEVIEPLIADAREGMALAGGVEKLAIDSALRRRLGDAGRRLVESRFTPARETEGYLEIYARVVGKPLA